MYRNQLLKVRRKRIESLFANLEQETSHFSIETHPVTSGWTWECDPAGNYIACSPEVEPVLGINAAEFLGQPLTRFRLTSQSTQILESAIDKGNFPLQVQLDFYTQNEQPISVTIHILRESIPVSDNGNPPQGWSGFTRVMQTELKVDSALIPLDNGITSTGQKSWYTSARSSSVDYIPQGFLAEDRTPQKPGDGNPRITLTNGVLTQAGKESLLQGKPIIQNSQPDQPAVMAMPALIGDGDSSLLVEILEDTSPRNWSEDERLLVEQVTDQLTLALENAHLFKQTQNALAETELRAQELSTLNEMSRAFSSNLDVDSVLENIYTFTSKLMDTQNFYVALYHQEEDSLSFHHVIADNQLVNEDHPEWSFWGPQMPVEGLTGHVIRSKQPLLVEENALQKFKEIGLEFVEIGDGGVQSWLGVPMQLGEQVIGVIAVQNETTPHLYTQHHLDILTTIGNQGAIAIANARLLDETRRRNEDLAVINTIIEAASRSLDLESTLLEILDQVISLTGFQSGLISTVNSETEKLQLTVHRNLPEPLVQLISDQGLDGTLCELVFKRGELVYIPELNHTAPVDVSGLIAMNLKSYLGVPLISKGNTLGTICVFSDEPRSIKASYLGLMESIGQQVGVAVDNASLFEQTQQALEETENLYWVSARISAAQSYNEILNSLCDYTILGHADSNTTIDIFNRPWTKESKPDFVNVLAKRFPISTDQLRAKHKLDNLNLAELYLKPDNPTTITDVQHDPRLDDYIRHLLINKFQAQSAIFLPLVVAGEWIGFINGIYQTKTEFPEKEIRRLMTLVGQAAVAIQNIRLLEESRRKADQLQTAAEIARDSSSTLALDTLLDRAVSLICHGFDYYHATVFLLDESEQNAIAHASTGDAGAEMKRRGHKLAVGSKSIIGYVTQTGEPLVVNDVSQDPIHRPNPLLPNTRAELGIPLKIGNRVIGAFDVQSTDVDAFKPDDIAVLQTLAAQIAVAVDNARSYELSLLAVDEMRKADQLKSQFLANMSHELRTPLNSIIGFSRVILKGIDGPITETQEQDLEAIYNSGQHLLNLINDILDLSKIEAGKMDLTFENNINLSDLINSVMSTVVGLVKDKPIELHQNIDPDLPTVRADPIKVRQVLINLFSNAAKFTDEGSITISAGTQIGSFGHQEVVIQVTDTGKGISSEDQKKLFQPFSQVDASPTRKTGGSGLGLSICRHLVEMHGGQIGLDSKLGDGSTFYFTLPVSDPITGTFRKVSISDPIILAIDDDPQIINLYERYLNDHGYHVYALTNPTKAVETASRIQPYAITLDIMMPERDGWQVLEALKSNPNTQNIPVIFCSILEEQDKGFSLGATDYLMKPILEDDLIGAIERLNADGSIQEILVCDDDLDDLRLVQRIFQDHKKYHLRLAKGVDQAIVEIQAKRPHAVVMDLLMPNMDGFNLLERLKTDPDLKDIPIIVLSSRDLDEEEQSRLSDFSLEMIHKGLVSDEEIFNTIEKTLNRYYPSNREQTSS